MHEATTLPRLGRHHVARPRLTELLDAADARVVLLVAPAGYGKTSLVVEWLAGKAAAWYRATSAAADVAAFSVGIADAMARLAPGVGERLRQRLRGGDLTVRSVPSLAQLLAEDLENWPSEAWLAIDDYHLVAQSPAVETFIEELLESTSVRLVVTARDRPRWASARRILHGEIVELGVHELALTRGEIKQVLGDATDPDLASFVELAEGWPVLVAVARLSPSVEAPVSPTSGALFRYFAEEILRREPADVQAFMLAAAVPETIYIEAVPSVAGTGAAPALTRLVDAGLIREAEEKRLRFHPLLREFLRGKLRAEDDARFASVAAQAIEHATSRRLYGDALDLAFEIGGAHQVADVLVGVVADLLAAGEIETVDRWLALSGSQVLERPPLAAAQAEVLIRRGELVEGASLAYDLARRLPSDDEWYSRAWYLAGHGFVHLSKYDLALECLRHAREGARTEHEITKAYATSIHLAYNLGHDIGGLVDEFAGALPENLAAKLWLAQCRVLVMMTEGTLAQARDTFEPLIPVAKYVEDPALRAVFIESAAAAATFGADYERGLALAREAVKICRDFHLPAVKTMFSLLFLAAAAIGLRRFAEAEAALDEVSRSGLRQTKHLVAAEAADRLRLLLARRRFGEAVHVARALDTGGLPSVTLGEAVGLASIAEASSGNLARAGVSADRALKAARSPEGAFYARFGVVIATMRNAETPRHHWRAAISLVRDAANAGVLDAFVVAYRAYPPLLALVADDEATFPIVARVVRAANDVELAREVGVLLPEVESGERLGSLTQREVEVFGLVSEGLSNAEIAKRLFVSESTVKVHVHHILEKLGAKTRLQAVLMAK